MTSLVVVLLVLVPLAEIVSSNDDVVGNVIIDIANNFNTACLRFLRVGLTNSRRLRHYSTAKDLIRDSVKDSRMITIASITFNQYKLVVEAHARGEESCYKSLQIFHANEVTKREFQLLCKEYKISATKWLVFMSDSSEELFFQDIAIPFDAHILTAVPFINGFLIREVHKITNHTPIVVKYVGHWFPGKEMTLKTDSMYLRRSDLNGMRLRTGSIENWPVSTFKSPFYNWPVLDGFFPRVWRELERKMNFTSVNYRSTDNTTGDIDASGNWTGLMGMVVRNEIDVIVSELNINEERTVVLEFTRPLLMTKYQVYLRMDGYNLSWSAVLEPFDSIVWFALLAWILISASILSVCFIGSRPFTYPSDMSLDSKNTVFFMLQSLCQQGYSQVPETISCRLIFLMAYLMSSILIPSYSASLISSLTAQIPNRPFDSFEGMLEHGRYGLLVAKNTAEYSHFARTKNALYSRVFERFVNPFENRLESLNNSADGVQLLCGKERYLAFFGAESTVDLRVQRLENQDCQIIKFSQPLSTIYQGMGLLKNHPYTSLINFHIQHMTQTGVIQRLRKSVWPIATIKYENSFKQVQVSEVIQIFACLLVGMILSVLILMFEIMSAKTQKRNKAQINSRSAWFNQDNHFY